MNKIGNWHKTKDCLPVLDKMVIIQDKDDKHQYRIAALTRPGCESKNREPYFLCWSDNDGGCNIDDVSHWAYIKLR